MENKYDFSGWATRNDLRCSDGRTIRRDAFKDNDGTKVPLVWNHQHNSADNVLGHAMLENRREGVYAYCTFNGTESGQSAKLLVEHGDVDKLSIYANQLNQRGGDVLHGCIREVSLVLAGANPGAYIDSIMQHDEASEDEAIIYTGEFISLSHSDEEDEIDDEVEETPDETVEHSEGGHKTAKAIFDTYNDEQKELFAYLVGCAASEPVEHSDEDGDDYDAVDDAMDKLSHGENELAQKFERVLSTYNEEQRDLLYAIVGHISNAAKHSDESEAMEHSDDNNEGENFEMRNAFDQNHSETETNENEYLTHAEELAIIEDAPQYGSMRQSALKHGITNIEYLFPENKEVGPNAPRFINKDVKWVGHVMSRVHHTPFARIKTAFADITADEARARGYVKGAKKVDEVFTLLKRTTDPQTIYKKQSLDRDDVVDITSFDVISWLKGEMRMKLDEEIARAILVGDGRTSMHADKIKEDKIRPIWTDDELYTIPQPVEATKEATDAEKAAAFMDAVIIGMEKYEGSGNVDLFVAKHMLTMLLLQKNKIGERIYKSKADLATAMMVDDIIPVPCFDGLTRKDLESADHDLMGIAVDLRDYNVGADKGGAVNMFDDFDIDYNKEKYLIETRISGALVLPHSAIALEIVTPGA